MQRAGAFSFPLLKDHDIRRHGRAARALTEDDLANPSAFMRSVYENYCRLMKPTGRT